MKLLQYACLINKKLQTDGRQAGNKMQLHCDYQNLT